MLPRSRKSGLVIQEMDDELLVYDLREEKAICLNETSAIVWKNCDGSKTIGEIASSVKSATGKPVSDEVVWFAIDQLKKGNLLEPFDNYSNVFDGMSRREVVKRIGLFSAIALPIVTSLAAPMAIAAQSCPPAGTGMADIPAGSGCPCTQPQDCSGGSCMNDSMVC